MRRRYLIGLYELLWRLWLWLAQRSEAIYVDADWRASRALYRRDHADGGVAAASWHRDEASVD